MVLNLEYSAFKMLSSCCKLGSDSNRWPKSTQVLSSLFTGFAIAVVDGVAVGVVG